MRDRAVTKLNNCQPLGQLLCLPSSRHRQHRHPLGAAIDDKATPTVVGCDHDRRQTNRTSSRPRSPRFTILSENAKRETAPTEICSWFCPLLPPSLLIPGSFSLGGVSPGFLVISILSGRGTRRNLSRRPREKLHKMNWTQINHLFVSVLVFIPWDAQSDICATFLAVLSRRFRIPSSTATTATPSGPTTRLLCQSSKPTRWTFRFATSVSTRTFRLPG